MIGKSGKRWCLDNHHGYHQLLNRMIPGNLWTRATNRLSAKASMFSENCLQKSIKMLNWPACFSKESPPFSLWCPVIFSLGEAQGSVTFSCSNRCLSFCSLVCLSPVRESRFRRDPVPSCVVLSLDRKKTQTNINYSRKAMVVETWRVCMVSHMACRSKHWC